ncbi:MAG: type VII secretion protein EccE [Jatrophihabitans sp.]|uniref:type VII secretion protein EccE n=1 Tax=Jatrophihabitans sp. TaxID=1932789 RepID=UPI003F7E546C
MPQPTREQLLLVEVAGAAGVGGVAAGGVWRIVGVAAGVLVLLVALAPVGRLWLYQAVPAWWSLRGRRRQARSAGLVGLVGEFEVVPVPATTRGRAFAAIRSGSTWSVPLEVALDGVLADDRPVPLEALRSLVRVEDVVLGSVRLLTVAHTASPVAAAPLGPLPPLPHRAGRYVVLTLDAYRSVDAINARGGTDAAVTQILRRCSVRADEVLTAAGLRVRLLDEAATQDLLAEVFGPPGGPVAADETRGGVRIPGGWSRTGGLDAAHRTADLGGLYAALPGRTVVDAVLATPEGDGVRVERVVRVMGGEQPRELADGARRAGVRLRTARGDQASLLCATSALGWA